MWQNRIGFTLSPTRKKKDLLYHKQYNITKWKQRSDQMDQLKDETVGSGCSVGTICSAQHQIRSLPSCCTIRMPALWIV